MSVYLAPGLVVTDAVDFGGHLPIIGWDNLVTTANITADHEDADYPAVNLANPATVLGWKSDDTGTQYLTIDLSVLDPVDYLAVARHNFGTAGISLTVEGLSAEEEATWEVLVDGVPADDSPILFRFTETNLIGLRLKMEPDATAPEAAVLFCGKLLVMERGVQVGHTPLPYARERDLITGRSERGEYLGVIQSGGAKRSTVEFRFLTPEFYRSDVDPFIANGGPFFFAWAPSAYPNEVGYCWFTNDPRPVPSHLAGYIDLSLELEGMAL